MSVYRFCMTIAAIAALVIATPVMYAQDDCASATAVSEGSHAYDTSGGTTSGAAACDADMSNDTWFAYTASCDGDATFSTCGQTGTDTDSVLIVYDGCANANGACLGSADDGCGASNFMSTVTIAVTGGSTYMVQVGGWQGPGGTGTLDITMATACGDVCATAAPVSEGAHAYDTSAGGTSGAAACDGDMSNDTWFAYTASCDGDVTFSTCGQTGTDSDSVLIVYDSCANANGACLGSADDGCGASNFMSTVTIAVTGGSTYMVQVGGWQGPGGTGTLDITLDDGGTCCSATSVGEGAHAYDTSAGNTSGAAACDGDMSNDTWFAYTASCNGDATFSTCGQTGTDSDSVLIVYDGCANANGACLGSADDGCGASNFMSTVTIAVTGGSTYMVQVGGWQGPGGTGTLDITLAADNGICCGATPVGEGAHAYDTSGGSTSGAAACDGDMSNDTWFAYTAGCDGDATISTCSQSGSDSDSVLIVYDGCANANGACITSADDGCGASGYMSSVTFAVTGGSTYMVQVGGWQGPGGTGTLDITNASAPESNCADGIDDDCDGLIDCDDSDCAGSPDCSNDDCASAYPVGEGAHAYDTSGGTTSGAAACDADMSNDHWFLYTASANGDATFSTCSQSGTDSDSVLIIYASCADANGACIDSADDGCGASGYMSSVTTAVTGGTSYLVQVGGWQGPGGTGTLDISLVACTADECCGAAAVGEGSHAYDTSGGTTSGAAACDGDMSNDTWFAYTASADGTATISTCSQSGSDSDSVLIVYDGCANANGACITSADDGCGASGYMSSVTFAVTGGTSYMVQLGGWQGPGGTGDLDISLTPPDTACAAIPMTDGANAFDTTGFPGTGTAPGGCSNFYGGNWADGWYTYTPAADGLVDINTCDPNSHDTDLAIYEGDCNAPILIACDGDGNTAAGCQSYDSALNGLLLTGGVTYLINIGGYSASQNGPGTCNITFTPLAPEDCATPGDEDGNGLADCADPACVAEPQCQEAGNCADLIDNDLDGDVDCADADCAADAACAGCPTGLSQNVSDVVDTSSVLCANAGQVAGDNTYARSFDTSSFDCPAGIRVTGVNFGIGLVTNPDGLGIPVTISVWLDGDGGAADAGMTLVSSEDVLIFEADASSTQSLTLATPAALPSGATLVVGTTLHDTVGSGNLIRVGHNSAGQSGPIYFDALACGLAWGTLDAIGFGDNHVVITLVTDDQGAGAAGDECSTAIPVTEGANAFDTTGFSDSPEPDPTGCTSSYGQNANDGWFSYTASYSGNVTMDTCDAASFDTDLAGYSGDCANLTLIACDGDGNAPAGCQGFDSVINLGLVQAGETILVRVGGWGAADQGPGTLNITNVPPLPTINEIRFDQPGSDTDEYFELAGFPQSLDGLTYVVIGDGADAGNGSGVIENATDLTGQAMAAGGYWWAGDNVQTLGTPDFDTNLSFENGDTVTHMLVLGFTGAVGDDLDTDDDGTLDSEPWSAVVDSITMHDDADDTPDYSANVIDLTGLEGHIERCPDGSGPWAIANYDHTVGSDTPGAANSCLAPPTNDECDTALDAFVGVNDLYNVSATDSADAWDPACADSTGGAMAADVWYRFVAPGDGTVGVSTCDTNSFDTDISWSTGACGALTQIACSGDAGDGTGNGGACQAWYSEMTGLSVTSGSEYMIRIGGWSAADQGSGIFTITFAVEGDEPCDAVEAFDGTTIVDNTNATDGTVPTGAAADSNCTGTFLGQFDSDMWFSYTATCEGTVTIDTCDPNGIDTDLAVYEGDCATLDQPIACNGDDTTLTGCQGFTSLLEFTATLGATYLIRVGGWSDNSGGVTEMHISCAPDAVDPTASFVLSGYSEYSINFRPVTLTDASDDGGDVNATVDIDWGDGSPIESVSIGSSTPHVYAIALVPGATGFLATPSVTITNVVGSNTISGDQLTILLIGDANNDLASDAADVVTVLTYLYGGGTYNCYQVADLNGDETVNLGDIVYALYYFFVPGSAIPVLPSNPNCDL